MDEQNRFIREHSLITRRFFFGLGAIGATAYHSLYANEPDETLKKYIKKLDPWITAQDDFQDVSRGRPKPHSLSAEQRVEAGLTRDTWKLQITSDPEHPTRVRSPINEENPFRFEDLMRVAKDKAVRFPKVMTCLNIGCPLGNGIWEGVPLRDVLWLTQPVQDLRRIFYYGYHNDDPEQMFRSSLPVGRILEDYADLPPVILCYKLNGQWLTPERGGPVRVVVPEAYGFKSIKWLSNIVLSNIAHANDTYAEKNNDVDSPLKTFCATLEMPESIKAGDPIPITGWAQSGISGLKKVQVWIYRHGDPLPEDDRYFTSVPWRDATILPPPNQWQNIVDQRIPLETHQFNSGGRPKHWPMKLSKAHWAILHPGLPAGRYTLRCRTIDNNGAAQPMPRPFRKSGHAAIEQRPFTVS